MASQIIGDSSVRLRDCYHQLPCYCLTLSVGFHPGRCVDSVTKQAIARHLQPHHSSHHRTCKNDDAMQSWCFPHYWPFVRGIQPSPNIWWYPGMDEKSQNKTIQFKLFLRFSRNQSKTEGYIKVIYGELVKLSASVLRICRKLSRVALGKYRGCHSVISNNTMFIDIRLLDIMQCNPAIYCRQTHNYKVRKTARFSIRKHFIIRLHRRLMGCI